MKSESEMQVSHRTTEYDHCECVTRVCLMYVMHKSSFPKSQFSWRSSSRCCLVDAKICLQGLWRREPGRAGLARFPRSDISSLKDNERLMMANSLLKIVHLVDPLLSPLSTSNLLHVSFGLNRQVVGSFSLCAGQTLIASNQVGSTQTVVWPMSPWWRLSLNVIM